MRGRAEKERSSARRSWSSPLTHPRPASWRRTHRAWSSLLMTSTCWFISGPPPPGFLLDFGRTKEGISPKRVFFFLSKARGVAPTRSRARVVPCLEYRGMKDGPPNAPFILFPPPARAFGFNDKRQRPADRSRCCHLSVIVLIRPDSGKPRHGRCPVSRGPGGWAARYGRRKGGTPPGKVKKSGALFRGPKLPFGRGRRVQ